MAFEHPYIRIKDVTPEKMSAGDGWSVSEFRIVLSEKQGCSSTMFHAVLRPGDRRHKHRFDNWQMLRETNRQQYRAGALPIAYAMIEFVEDGDIDESLFTQDFISDRKRLDVAGTVGTAVSNTRLEITTTSLKGNPQLAAA